MVLRSTASPRTDLASPQHPLWPQIRWWWLLAMVVSTDSVQIDGFYLMKPVIALVGRPNVGKSTLFNRLTKSRHAIAAAVAEADVVIFVVDARAGVSAQDHDIANYLRRLGKPCVLVANKAEGMLEGV